MQKRYLTIGLILLFVTGALFVMRPVVFPCLASIIAAYLFNPLVVRFEKYKIPRFYSVIFIIFVLLIIFIFIITFILPIIYVQIASILNLIISKIPSLQNKVIPFLLEFLQIKIDDNLLGYLSKNLEENYSDYVTYFINVIGFASDLIIQALNSSFNLFSLIVITPVIFFYILRDWPLIVKKADNLIPMPYKKQVADYLYQVDFVISNYLRSQVNVCIIMMIFYSVGLTMLGLKHSIAIGILSGALTFIPYIGPLLYSTIGFLSAVIQFSGWFESVAVLLLFCIGQFIDSNILVPLLVGKKVHIHSAVIILGITICIAYFGFVGMLLFIPMIATFNVSMEFAVNKYLKSELYKNG